MKERHLPALPPEVRDLLDVERGRPGIPDTARKRISNRVATSIETGAEPLLGPLPDRLPRETLFRGWRMGLSGFALGALSGAILHAVVARPLQPMEMVLETRPMVSVPSPLRTVAIPAATARPAPVPVPAEAPRPRATPRVPAAEAAPKAEPRLEPGLLSPPEPLAEKDHDLAAERALLEVARTAVSRGQSEATLTALERHERRFPAGRLAEERDSLRVQALAQAGRGAEARERAARYRRDYPDSLLLPAVEAALRSLATPEPTKP